MDVGFNNRNTLGQFAPEFEDVKFFIDATSEEQFGLWQDYSKESMSYIEPISDEIMKLITATLLFEKRLLDPIQELNKKVKRNYRERADWKQINSGFSIVIGHVDDRPVNVSFMFAIVNGHKICFYDIISQVADHKMVEKWLKTHFQLTHDGYCRWNHTNATNFHNCIQGLEKMDKEPRDTVYQHED